jgi:hypothetical protein
MELRFWTALADSMRAMMRTGSLLLPLLVAVLDGCLSGLKCRMTSVTKCRSAALSHFGSMIASRYSPLSTSVKSFSARPVSTLFIRTHISLIPDGRCLFNISRRFARASDFMWGATLSSRSYVTLSACIAKDFSSIFFDEDGTAWCVSYLARQLREVDVPYMHALRIIGVAILSCAYWFTTYNEETTAVLYKSNCK